MKKLIQFILKSQIGKEILALILTEFVDWLKLRARLKYGPANVRVDYTMNFLDSLTDDITEFIKHDCKTPVVEITLESLKKKV